MKRTMIKLRESILKILKDGNEHSYGELERKANTNWKSVRNHCKDLEFFGVINISKDNKIKITNHGRELLKKLKN